mgnify:CR=1 FL=1
MFDLQIDSMNLLEEFIVLGGHPFKHVPVLLVTGKRDDVFEALTQVLPLLRLEIYEEEIRHNRCGERRQEGKRNCEAGK